jgi:hypothetical protein
MSLTRKQRLFVEAVISNPSKPLTECAKEAGYSKKRLSETASILKSHREVQDAITAILDKKLAAAPTRESYHKSINEVREMARRAGDCQWAGTLLLKCAEMEGRELGIFEEQPAPSATEVDARTITVNFIEPEQGARLNASAQQFEQRHRLPAGSLGRLSPEGEQEAGPELLSPSAPAPVPAYVQPVTDAERQRLRKLCMPVGGGLQTQECRFGHGCYEAVWQQAPNGTWGWSDCPKCWQVN